MPFRLTKDVSVLANGFTRRAGKPVGVHEVPPQVWAAWIVDGIVIEVQAADQLLGLSLEALRDLGKDAGIRNAHLMKEETLRERLTEVGRSPVAEEEDDGH